MVPTRSQFRGCLIGQALGDALGTFVEGAPSEVARGYVEEVLPGWLAGEPATLGPYRLGQYTDDTQLARELVQSVVDRKEFDPAAYAVRVMRLFTEDRIVGRGRSTEEAAARLALGIPWDEAGTPPPSAGNGSAMRAAPVGLLCFEDPDRLVRWAVDQGRITHADARCSAGAVAVAGATALALRPGPLDVASFVAELSALVRRVDASVADAVAELPVWVELEAGDAVGPITALAGDDDPWDGISPFVTSSVAWSLFAFLRSPDDYWETICTAIAAGGDVDTTAAMAGAISGARLGLEGIPAHLAALVTDQETWGYEELVALADAACDLAVGDP
jgi:ADP-ribosylglycohydrolase